MILIIVETIFINTWLWLFGGKEVKRINLNFRDLLVMSAEQFNRHLYNKF